VDVAGALAVGGQEAAFEVEALASVAAENAAFDEAGQLAA
jgi:hypothetical protein